MPKRILCINDISCVGRCSLTVILPILATMGIEACPLPTAVLSTHTGGFGAPAVLDMRGFAHDAL
ncbi:MAG: pyridoxamine kinase, partial [Oscillospiraceae bacterium]